jgi:hypothetical protein
LITQPCYDLVKDHIVTVDHAPTFWPDASRKRCRCMALSPSRAKAMTSTTRCKKIWFSTSAAQGNHHTHPPRKT